MIPLIGCSVELISGKYAGEKGDVVAVRDYSYKLRTMSEPEAKMFVRGKRSSLGEDWDQKWYEATVRLESGVVVESVDRGAIRILDEEQVRKQGYRTVWL